MRQRTADFVGVSAILLASAALAKILLGLRIPQTGEDVDLLEVELFSIVYGKQVNQGSSLHETELNIQSLITKVNKKDRLETVVQL